MTQERRLRSWRGCLESWGRSGCWGWNARLGKVFLGWKKSREVPLGFGLWHLREGTWEEFGGKKDKKN